MTADILVVLGAVVSIVGLAYFFFGPKQSRKAEIRGGVQQIALTVKGGYSPDLIEVRQGVPVRLVFDRQEAGDCTSRVVFPDLQISKSLPAFTRTTVEFTPQQAGRFEFACGMNMIHGTLVVDPPGTEVSRPQVPPDKVSVGEAGGEVHRHGEHTHEVARAVGVGPRVEAGGHLSTVEFALVADGVACPTCVTHIEGGLAPMAGVDHVGVNYGAGRIKVVFDPTQVSVADLGAAVER